MTQDDAKNVQKSQIFSCSNCDYKCSGVKLLRQHFSLLHSKEDDAELRFGLRKNVQKAHIFHKCDCGKKYKYRQGLWKHKQLCDYERTVKICNNADEPTDKNLIMLLLQENTEIKHMMLDICKQIQPNIYSNTINSNNKTFNLNLFLNEECKDAMNIMDFVNSLKIKLSDLENLGKMGYVNGISNIIINNLKALDIHKRPVHCSDSKREVIYIKDQDKWEKENDEKLKMKTAIKHVTNKNINLISEWKQQNPDCIYSESSKSDQYNHIILESMNNSDVNDEKIIRNVARQVVINKNL